MFIHRCVVLAVFIWNIQVIQAICYLIYVLVYNIFRVVSPIWVK